MKYMGSKDPFLREILYFSLCCRGATLAMQVVFNLLIPDHIADAFSPPRAPPSGYGNQLTELFLGGLGRWDAEHFLFIAEHGYVFEHNMAFFPLFPLTLAGLAYGLLWPLGFMLSVRSRLLLSAALLNTGCFVLAAIVLYRLGCVALQSRRSAFLAALLFCMNPASIFMTVAYSESLFALATFAGLWQLEKCRPFRGCFLFSLATAARANGLVNAGFLLYFGVQSVIQGTISCRRIYQILLATAVIILPFALFQYYSFQHFCSVSAIEGSVTPELMQLAIEKEYRVHGLPVPAWCAASLPLAYSNIQSDYWDVGLFSYFQLRQLPNFLLALPVILLGTRAIWEYAFANVNVCMTLGLWEKRQTPSSGYYGPRIFIYVAHLTALMMFGVFCMHVQVITRFLFSSSPVLFWFCSLRLQQNEPWMWGLEIGESASNPAVRLLYSWTSLQRPTRFMLGYFLGYWLLGTALHVNFLPWT
ncbi:GPI mannosyltransferase 2 [Xenopus laevis]|uniref:GPI mannosyltransferase 2 n=2 Tax=Xenopus laevis TaxID=8355 RepID=A0A1L8H7D7_XENLA|nr:GPI mannosyltransferase 2 [Xenopus laevis]XP_018104934.1 GPI mannosyltransferase 2 [Xenopus laevis]XP_018104935.1 GPI mannosyltransferase 2 [Xenopus laevis]OCT92012.1 hypothetical protein XELAEV_18015069mg [Xenopus laevis]